MKRIIKIVLKTLLLLVATLLVVGITYEQLERRADKRRFPQIGRSVDIGGRSLNIFCSGSGVPAVILDPARGIGLEWDAVQKGVSRFTQACWFDRAGMGWSDAGPYPPTAAASARDLHALLAASGVPGPYVFSGVSYGGLLIRIHGGMYPSDVAGMVLVDAAHEDESVRAPKFYLARTAPPYLWHPLDLAFETAAFTGLIRLTQSPLSARSDADRTPSGQLVRALAARPQSVVVENVAGIVEPETFTEVPAAGALGDRPLIVLTAGKPLDFGDPEMNEEAAQYQQIWIHEIQAKLLQLSTRSRQIVLPDANHASIPTEAVVAAIHDVVNEVRSTH